MKELEEGQGHPATLPEGLERRNDIEAIREDLMPYMGTTQAERAEILESLCRYAAEQIAGRSDGQRILVYQGPRSARSLALWKRLVAEWRSRR